MTRSRSLAPLLFALSGILLATTARAEGDPSAQPPLAAPPPPGKDGALEIRTVPWRSRVAEWPRMELALQTGIALPAGKRSHGHAMNDFVSPELPLWFEVGIRVTPAVALVGYASIALGGAASDIQGLTSEDKIGRDVCEGGHPYCAARTSQGGIGIRVRGRAIALPWIGRRVVAWPWVGYSAGYEWTSLESYSGEGIVFGHASVGADIRVAEDYAIGPMLDVGLGRYSRETTPLKPALGDGDARFHEWITFGVRASVTL